MTSETQMLEIFQRPNRLDNLELKINQNNLEVKKS